MTTYTTIRYAGEDFDREECQFYPPVITDAGIRCGHHGNGPAVYHQTVAAVRACRVAEEDMRLQQEAELRAEQSVERYYEQGDPESWEAERIERMTEAYGYGPPPGFRL